MNSWLLDDFDAAQSPSLTAKTSGKRNAVKAGESGADADLSENVRLLLHRLDRLDTRVKAGRRTTSLSRQRSHAGTAACRAARVDLGFVRAKVAFYSNGISTIRARACNHGTALRVVNLIGCGTPENNPMATTVERAAVHQDGHWSSRSISILAALAVDAGLVWLLFLRAKYNPPVGEAELFWVRVIAAFGFYAVLQQWTLANQTGRGDDITAAFDKFVAASPIVVAAVIEAYWLGAEGSAALSWRHHAVAALWSAFAITDFFATDITNQRLRARQFNVGDGAG